MNIGRDRAKKIFTLDQHVYLKTVVNRSDAEKTSVLPALTTFNLSKKDCRTTEEQERIRIKRLPGGSGGVVVGKYRDEAGHSECGPQSSRHCETPDPARWKTVVKNLAYLRGTTHAGINNV